MITICDLYGHGSLFALLYCVNISICIQKPIELEQYTGKPRMYDETHQIQIALITKCGLYTHGSLFTLPYLSINAFRNQNGTHVNLECTIKTHQIQITLITKCGLYTHGSLFNLLYLSINISRCIQNPEWYTRKPGMYNENSPNPDYIDYKCGLYAHGSLFALLYLGVNVSRHT